MAIITIERSSLLVFGNMAKRLHKEQNLELKYKSLLEPEKSKSNKRLHNYLLFQQIHFPHGKKIKDKIFQALQQKSATTQRVKVDNYDQVEKAVLKWFKRLRFENVPVNGVFLKEKALYFAKELIFENFQASDSWLDKWEKRLGLIFFFTLFYYIMKAI